MGSVYGDSSTSPEFVVPVMEKVNIIDEDELRHILLTNRIVSICMCDIRIIFVKRNFPTFVTTTMEEQYRQYCQLESNDLHCLRQPMACIVGASPASPPLPVLTPVLAPYTKHLIPDARRQQHASVHVQLWIHALSGIEKKCTKFSPHSGNSSRSYHTTLSTHENLFIRLNVDAHNWISTSTDLLCLLSLPSENPQTSAIIEI